MDTLFPRCLRNPCSDVGSRCRYQLIPSIYLARSEKHVDPRHCNGNGSADILSPLSLFLSFSRYHVYASTDGRSRFVSRRHVPLTIAPSDSRVPSFSLILRLAIGVVINRHGLSPLWTRTPTPRRNTEGKQEEQCQKAFISDSLSDAGPRARTRFYPSLYPSRCALVTLRSTRVSWACLSHAYRGVPAFIAAGN